ncbi:hypothetical protein [Cupriavidus sp. Agwp_2]|uniref:hypothetical protein n=1 Tax=Cupriavidus sp. Agwp_2 TaxID=2897324 RepID=UPI00345FA83F
MASTWFERLVKRPKPLTSEPPADVLAAIDAAHIVPRFKSDDGARAFVMLPERRGFVLNDDRAVATILAAFPDLNDEQAKRAAQYLLDRARIALRESAKAAEIAEHGERWADWRPLPKL